MKLEINVQEALVTIDVAPDTPLWVAWNQAFGAAGRLGEPLENWEIRDEEGHLLDNRRTIGEFGFTDSTRLFLNLKPAVGG